MKKKILYILMILFLFFLNNSMALESIPLTSDPIMDINKINPVIDYYSQIEIFTKNQNKNNIKNKANEEELIENINNSIFSVNLIKQEYDIKTEIEKYNIFNNIENKSIYIVKNEKKYGFEIFLIIIILLILCILTYILTKKKHSKGEKDEYNIYFAN